MTSADKWKLNITGYFEKTFAYEGAGILSTSHGNGAAATQVTLVVEQYGAAPPTESSQCIRDHNKPRRIRGPGGLHREPGLQPPALFGFAISTTRHLQKRANWSA